MKNPRIKAGDLFGRLQVIERVGVARSKNKSILWKCRCICGGITVAKADRLRSGHTKSCGCYQIEAARQRATKHGYSGHQLHVVWRSMMDRCCGELITRLDELERDFGDKRPNNGDRKEK